MSQLDVGYRDSSLSRVHVESPLAGLVDASSWPAALRAARQSWTAPRAGERVPDGPCRYRDGTGTSLYDELHGRTAFVLLLFAGSSTDSGVEADEAVADLLEIATAVGGAHVHPYLVVRDETRIPEGDGATILVDEHHRLHDSFDAAVPSLYLIRPDDHVGFRSRPARLDPLEEYLAERVLSADARPRAGSGPGPGTGATTTGSATGSVDRRIRR
jgi:hypothetical protein